MKNILPWIKSNTAIVVLSALILLILPAAFVGSSMWNSKIRKNREKTVTAAMSQLDAAKVTYTTPPAVPGGKPIEFPWPAPNKVATDHFRQLRTMIDGAVKQIHVEAEAINKQGHEPLLDGVFPKPASAARTLEFTELLVTKSDKQSAYQKLLDSIKAGPAADPVKVKDVLREADTQAMDKLKAERNTDKMTEEEYKAHLDRLVKLRIGQYKEHAKSISVYATTDCLPAGVPKVIPPEPPAVTDCWKWQEDYWAVRDLLTAVKEANLVDGKSVGVDRSVVKRIEQLTLYPLEYSMDTVTGRKNSPTNSVYEVRYATMVVVVSSSRLPQFINAISRTNFMSVVDVDLVDVDTSKDLDRGYYYGDEHVVQATVMVETIWLKSWTSALIPEEEKKRRESVGEETAAAPAAPLAPRAAPRAPDEDSGAKPKAGAKGPRSTKRPGAKKGGD